MLHQLKQACKIALRYKFVNMVTCKQKCESMTVMTSNGTLLLIWQVKVAKYLQVIPARLLLPLLLAELIAVFEQ